MTCSSPHADSSLEKGRLRRYRQVRAGFFALMLYAACQCALASTVVAGSVKDAVTGSPIIGAQLRVENGGVLLGNAATDDAGNFRLAFEIASRATPQNLKLLVRQDGYADTARDVVVISGRTDQMSYPIALLPASVAACRRPQSRSVVVGHFRPPMSAASLGDLAARIRDTVRYDVLAGFQRLKMPIERQPSFMACGQIDPPQDSDYPSLAKALMADAFLTGYVAPSGTAGSQKVKVQMSIADRYGVLQSGLRVSSPDIDLDDPDSAQLQAEALKAIFLALVTGYEKAGQAGDCIQAVNGAGLVLGTLPAELVAARKRCEKATPNSGLVRTGASP